MKDASSIFVVFLLLQLVQVSALSSTFGKNCTSTKGCGTSGFVCSNNTCSFCSDSRECKGVGHSLICKYDEHQQGPICKHKGIIPNVSYIDALLTLAIFVGGCLAAGGGIGGGGVFVPLLVLIGNFSPKDAIPLSNVLIGSASVANFVQMFRKRHPFADRPLIDYHLAVMLQPLCLAGTVIGVILNSLFPNWLILLLLVLVLILTVHRTTVKGLKLWKEEASFVTKLGEDLETRETGNIQQVALDAEKEKLQQFGNFVEVAEGTELDSELKAVLEQEAKTPIPTLVVMVCALLITSLFSLLKGSSTSKSLVGITPCSTGYWLTSVAAIPLLFVVQIGVAIVLIRRHNHKVSVNYQFKKGDVKWTPRNSILIGIVSFVAGILASLLGIGGGMVLSPLMLELQVLPEITAATSSFMILFTSTAAIVQYSVLGRLIVDYSVWFLFVGTACSVVGQMGLTKIVKRFKKTSVIVLCISLVISISTVLLVTIGILNLVKDIKAGVSIGFHSPC